MSAILNSLNVHNFLIFQPILMTLVSNFMVQRALADKTYILLGLRSPLIKSGEQRLHTYNIAVSNYKKSTSKSKSAKGINSKKIKYFFFLFSPIDLLIILYQLTKFDASSCYSFRDIMKTNFQSPNLQKEIIQKK